MFWQCWVLTIQSLGRILIHKHVTMAIKFWMPRSWRSTSWRTCVWVVQRWAIIHYYTQECIRFRRRSANQRILGRPCFWRTLTQVWQKLGLGGQFRADARCQPGRRFQGGSSLLDFRSGSWSDPSSSQFEIAGCNPTLTSFQHRPGQIGSWKTSFLKKWVALRV